MEPALGVQPQCQRAACVRAKWWCAVCVVRAALPCAPRGSASRGKARAEGKGTPPAAKDTTETQKAGRTQKNHQHSGKHTTAQRKQKGRQGRTRHSTAEPPGQSRCHNFLSAGNCAEAEQVSARDTHHNHFSFLCRTVPSCILAESSGFQVTNKSYTDSVCSGRGTRVKSSGPLRTGKVRLPNLVIGW